MSTAIETRVKVQKASDETLAQMQVLSWPIWEKEESSFDWHYDSQELCYFLEGEVTVSTDQGEISFGKGDLVSFPAGLSCKWHVHKAVRKHYKFS